MIYKSFKISVLYSISTVAVHSSIVYIYFMFLYKDLLLYLFYHIIYTKKRRLCWQELCSRGSYRITMMLHLRRHCLSEITQIAKFMRPTWGPSGSCRPQMGPMLAPWTLLSGHPRSYSVWGCRLTGMGFPSWKWYRHSIALSPRWGFLYWWDDILVIICLLCDFIDDTKKILLSSQR